MKKYVVTLTREALNSPATFQAVQGALEAQGARNIARDGLVNSVLLVDSPVELNFAAIYGIDGCQEVSDLATARMPW